MRANLRLDSAEFLSNTFYQNVRTLTCSERIKLANCYLAFDGVDLRFLYAGCFDVRWSDAEQLYIPRLPGFESTLMSVGALSGYQVDEYGLTSLIHTLSPGEDVLFVQQANHVGGVEFVTEVAVYRDGCDNIRVSEIRQNREGFDFEYVEDQLVQSYVRANMPDIKVVHECGVRRLISLSSDRRPEIVARHNDSICAVSPRLQDDLIERLGANLEHMRKAGTDGSDGLFALKVCAPICWYFNRIVQACLGMQVQYDCFSPIQMQLLRSMASASSVVRNMALMMNEDRAAELQPRVIRMLDKLVAYSSSFDKLMVRE